MRVSNNSGIPLALAVWLLHDDYDYINDSDYISVTRLMRPLRHIVIPGRIPIENRQTPDVSEFIARGLGNSIHHSIEMAWKSNPKRALKLLGYPDNLIDLLMVNPTPQELAANPDGFPIYLEQRAIREFEGKRIGGKFDMVTEGIVNDTKSTSAYSWVFGTRDDEHALQGSLYRWIDAALPEEERKITEDIMRVNYIFTDWSKMMARSNPKYPQKRLEQKEIPLLSLKETEDWVRWKLDQIQKFWNTPEPQLPECTDEELWRSEASFKYFSDVEKAKDPNARSSKNFTDLAEANKYWKVEKGGKGIVITKPGEVKRCGYCDAFDGCTQKDRYFA